MPRVHPSWADNSPSLACHFSITSRLDYLYNASPPSLPRPENSFSFLHDFWMGTRICLLKRFKSIQRTEINTNGLRWRTPYSLSNWTHNRFIFERIDKLCNKYAKWRKNTYISINQVQFFIVKELLRMEESLPINDSKKSVEFNAPNGWRNKIVVRTSSASRRAELLCPEAGRDIPRKYGLRAQNVK